MNNKIMKTGKTTIFAATFALSALLCSCSDDAAKAAAAKQAYADAASVVKVAHPIKKSIEVWDEYTARLEAVAFVELRSRVSGYLQKVYFSEGEEVSEGELLFLIDPRPYEAALSAAKAGVKEVEAKLVLAQSNLDRAKELYAANAISKEVFETRNSGLLEAQAGLLNAQARLRDAELNLEYTHIKAPMAGKVSESFVDAGNLVTANTSLLTTIVKSDIIQAYFEVSERDFQRYAASGLLKSIDTKSKTGPNVEVRTLGNADQVYSGKVTYFDNKIGTETASLIMRADLDNKDGHLTAGMFAKLRLSGGKPEEKLLVPEAVIGTDLINRYVIVIGDDGIAQYRPVKVGRLIGKLRVVEQGLSATDNVVGQGLLRAIPGRKVKAESYKFEE